MKICPYFDLRRRLLRRNAVPRHVPAYSARLQLISRPISFDALAWMWVSA